MTRSVTNEQQIAAAVRQQKLDADMDRKVVESLMSHPNGRRWCWLRLAEGQLFVEDSDLDPYRMAYAKGTRQPALRLLDKISRYCPREYIQMTEENTGVELRNLRQQIQEEEPDE